MERTHHERLIETLRGERVAPPARPALRVPADHYRSAARAEHERTHVFGGLAHGGWRGPPRVIAASSALVAGHCMPVELPGASLILTRGSDGVARGFANACRHRATRLIDAPCAVKAMVCPYHGWTYDLTGQLIHAPHAEAFTAGDRRNLGALPITERHGLVWIGADLAGYLGGLDADLAALGLDRHVVWRTRRATPRCNWKLIVEAFLDGYHIRILHRDSIYRFFLDAASRGEPVGPHIRAVTARRALRDAPAALAEVADLRTLATPSYVVFPGTVIIVHPDFVSCITLYPLAADVTDYDHLMLVPAARADEAAHWDKSWALIEDTVFQREDLWVCAQVQRGLAAGATDELVFGELEEPVRWFHAELDRALAAAP